MEKRVIVSLKPEIPEHRKALLVTNCRETAVMLPAGTSEGQFKCEISRLRAFIGSGWECKNEDCKYNMDHRA